MMAGDGGYSRLLRQIGRMFGDAGFSSRIFPQTLVAIWEKLAFNAAINPVSAVLPMSVGECGDSLSARKLIRSLAEEAMAVAHALHNGVDRHRVHAALSLAFAEHRDHWPSMLQDRRARRRTEIDAINGAVVREVDRLCLVVNANRTMLHLVQSLESFQGVSSTS